MIGDVPRRLNLKQFSPLRKKPKMEKFLAEKLADPVEDLRNRISDKEVEAALATK